MGIDRRAFLSASATGLVLAGCGGAGSVGGTPAPSQPAPPSLRRAPPLPAGPARFLVGGAAGLRFEDGTPAILRGMAFGNEVYSHNRLPYTHHDERDFARLRALGMNLVRFYLHYRTFEDDGAPYAYLPDGWAWLDQNVRWARDHGVYLILNMHAPQGGYQSTGQGGALWREPDNAARLTALWRAIAERYANEPVIAGYDLLNEPVVSTARSQWHTLAQRIARAIREVDGRHPVIVERVNAVGTDWSSDADMNLFRIDDPNPVYTFHFYDPFEYSHQYTSWTDLARREGGVYPDPARGRDRAWLAAQLERYLRWARREGVALYCGEFGLFRACFEAGRNGVAWAADMIDLLDDAGLPWTWHSWHEDHFGLYYGYGTLPDPAQANEALLAVLRAKLA